MSIAGLERIKWQSIKQSHLVNPVECQPHSSLLRHNLPGKVLKDIGLERSTHVNFRSATPIMVSSYFLCPRPPQNSQHSLLQMITAQLEWHQRHHQIICLHLVSLNPSNQPEWHPKAPPNSCTLVSQPHSWQPITMGYPSPLFLCPQCPSPRLNIHTILYFQTINILRCLPDYHYYAELYFCSASLMYCSLVLYCDIELCYIV